MEAGTEAGPPPARRGIRLAGHGLTSRGARVERRAAANRSAGRWRGRGSGAAAGAPPVTGGDSSWAWRAQFEPAGRMSRFLNVLRSWLVMVSVIAAGNTLQSFRDHGFLSEKLYTASPGLGKGRARRPPWRLGIAFQPWALGFPRGPTSGAREPPTAPACASTAGLGVVGRAVRGLHMLPPSLRSERAPGSDLRRLDPFVISDPLPLRNRHS